MFRLRLRTAIFLVLFAPQFSAQLLPAQKVVTDPEPKLLTWSQQLAMREQWLVKRHEMILSMMRKHGIDMWIIVNEEFHDDPLTQYIAPPRPYAGNRDVFVFIDTGDKGLRKLALTGYSEENLQRFFESSNEPKPLDKALPELYQTYHPQEDWLELQRRARGTAQHHA